MKTHRVVVIALVSLWLTGPAEAKPGYDDATLFDEDYHPKPAYFVLKDVLRAH